MAIRFRPHWLVRIDEARVLEAIAEAEYRTSGEIRVSISRFFWGPVRPTAERAFHRLKMDATKDRNGILFYIVPSRRKFVILGDEGIHARVGPDFWTETASALSRRFRNGEFTDGLIEGIRTAGERLAAHFPHDRATDRNELPDEIDYGRR
ncbi:MAG: TPM domain-containing protein [Candidatus Aminicenantes bacterium]|nr:TPM domain-containing protein [Candidatus Aminicenantes bacterium]